MIIVPIMLQSAVDGRVEVLATVVIDNTGGSTNVADYRCRMFGKQLDARLPDFDEISGPRPIRSGSVRQHRRLAEPVGNLVAKALAAMGYGK